MMLSIITINWNNAEGLEKTLKSVQSQTCTDFEHVIIDGASIDGSVDIIRNYEKRFGGIVRWVSERDKGIYNAMNKGIGLSSGEYVEFLNSGDCLASVDVVEKLYAVLEEKSYPSILYGNLLKDLPTKGFLKDKGFEGRSITLLGFYHGTLNHSSSFIRKTLFDKYGFYDESLKIVSDWKWFLQAIVFGGEIPIYVDEDFVIFDMNGISVTDRDQDEKERGLVLKELIPSAILADYDRWATSFRQVERLKRYPAVYKCFDLIGRCLFKIERITKR